MSKEIRVAFGRAGEYVPQHPDRTAYRFTSDLAGDVVFREWPSRGAMLTSIVMQGRRSARSTDWRDYLASRWARVGR